MFTLPPKTQLTIFILALGILLSVMVGSEKGVLRLTKLNEEQKLLELEVIELQAESAKLKEEISKLQSDRDYLERLAREKYGMSRPDEIIYQLK